MLHVKPITRFARYPIAFFSAAVFLWVSANAVIQSRLSMPGVSLPSRLGFILTGLPVGPDQLCPATVHDLYTTIGPDGNTYPTWHPVYDRRHSCAFDHEHGSDPADYVGIDAAGLPAFGYTAAQAGVTESHAGYKIYVSNDDLNGHAWMITAHQDTSTPERVLQQYHTLDWHISSTTGQPLVSLHVLADFGSAYANCVPGEVISPAQTPNPYQVSQQRSVVTSGCAASTAYESWVAAVNIAGVFEASPLLDVQNPVTAVDPHNISAQYPVCQFRSDDDRCDPPDLPGAAPWRGTIRGVVHPGQYVHNTGEEILFTDAFGAPVDQGAPGAILQFLTSAGWDTRDCCGAEVVFYIQTWSDGLYIPAPQEQAGSAEFWFR